MGDFSKNFATKWQLRTGGKKKKKKEIFMFVTSPVRKE